MELAKMERGQKAKKKRNSNDTEISGGLWKKKRDSKDTEISKLPGDIVMDILSRLPAKVLFNCRSMNVSVPWPLPRRWNLELRDVAKQAKRRFEPYYFLQFTTALPVWVALAEKLTEIVTLSEINRIETWKSRLVSHVQSLLFIVEASFGTQSVDD
ncbi:hypothetical protein HHK36_030542 [Tetracentron sinense]|uniref:F-box domain-containing protein n=1 Tax=Tetracentron sinense TaxID=13715 RepID=A0A834YD12_TETSI|nr:hypothetical protein HHK36_030542 [Tetracentron sinense]